MGRIIDMPLPRLGETMEEGRIGQRLKKPGEKFRRGETLLEVESDKTTVEVPALQDGILVEWLVSPDDMVPVESAIARIEIEGEAVAEAKARPSERPAASGKVRSAGWSFSTSPVSRPRASTAARALARKSGIDLSSLVGTGRNGRIMRADLAKAKTPARSSYHAATPKGDIFIREWPAEGETRGLALLIHGLFSDSQSFVTLGRKLGGKGYRTLAVDLPGHGETRSQASTIADIAAAIGAALPPVKLHIVGHSFGAVVAAHLAHRAASLTLLSPAGTGEEINADFIAAMLGGNLDRALGYLGESNIPAEAVASLAEHIDANGAQLRAIAAEAADGGKQKVSILSKLASLTIPVTAVYLRDDAIIPAQHALNLPPNVAARFLPGAGHLPHWRDPDLIVGLIARA